MAIAHIAEDVAQRQASVQVVTGRTYGRTWIVECDSPHDGPLVASSHPDIPTLRDYYEVRDGLGNVVESDTNAYVQSIEANVLEWLGTGVVYSVAVKYGPLDPGESEEPLERPIRIRLSFNEYERIIWVDEDGNAIRNSAGDPFGDPVVRQDGRPLLVVTRNEDVGDFDLTLAARYYGTVNQAAWNGFPARTVRCADIQTGDEQKHAASGVWYYTVTYVFEVKWETWTRYILDQGFAYLDSGERKPFLDSEGQPISEPKLLDGLGAELDVDLDPPVTLPFRVCADRDFTVFNINFANAIGRT